VAGISDYRFIEEGSESALGEAIATIGPVAVCIDTDGVKDAFNFYEKGVYNNPSCSTSQNEIDHCVLAVGYGTDNGNDYWLVKNSWGTDWGER
jgi:cathepsin L